jgi:hypothetical protein
VDPGVWRDTNEGGSRLTLEGVVLSQIPEISGVARGDLC